MNWWQTKRRDEDLERELRSDLELEEEEQRSSGLSPEESRYAARRAFGNTTLIKEQTRETWGWGPLERFLQDLRYTWRVLLKNPVFAAAAIITLALGIGATTAIFSAMNAVLLRSLPVPSPQQLVYLGVPTGQPSGAHSTGASDSAFSLPTFEALRQDRHVFSAVMAFVPLGVGKVAVRAANGTPEQAAGAMVSGNFFSGLGVAAARGRTLGIADETQNAAVAVLSYAYWTRRFSRNPAVLGETLYVKGVPFTIVGIAREGFPGVEPGKISDFWIPLQRLSELNPWGSSPDRTLFGSPNWWCLQLIARLAPGRTAQQAIAEATPEFRAAAYANLGTPSPGQQKVELSLTPARGIQGLGDYDREPILILMALVTLVLAIACSNVAMLIVARNASRQRDFSLRMALGAQRGALLRQLFLESGLLVICGASLGWLFALVATRALAAWFELDITLAPDLTALLFTSVVSMLAALVFGLAPIRTTINTPVTEAIRASASTSYQRRRGGSVVLPLQIALCFTLLMAAGLLLRTLLNYEHTNLGMRTQGLLVFGITPQRETTNDARFTFYRDLLGRLRAVPGVESATFVRYRLGSGWSASDDPIVDGVKFEQVPLRTNNLGPDFLHVMGIPLLEGRDIRDSDTATSPHVVVVNETFVKKLLPTTNPIGHQLGDPKDHPYTIVGVAKDSKYRSVDEEPRAMAYYPYTQNGAAAATLLVELRTDGDPFALLPTVERVVYAMDANLPLEKPMTQAAVFEDSYSDQRMFSCLAMFFGLLAALLVGIGLYGTLSYRINRRSAEIGIRMALGAQRAQVLRLVLTESFQIATVGVAIGIPFALIAGHLMGSMLYALDPYDTLSLFFALIGIAGISFAAGFIPAHRAASIDPMRALRSE